MTERGLILSDLLSICESSKETKLLISCRSEDDISRILRDKVEIIRVDHWNCGCIQAYVSTKTEEWLMDPNFDDQARSEIRALLAPLSSKAKGKLYYLERHPFVHILTLILHRDVSLCQSSYG